MTATTNTDRAERALRALAFYATDGAVYADDPATVANITHGTAGFDADEALRDFIGDVLHAIRLHPELFLAKGESIGPRHSDTYVDERHYFRIAYARAKAMNRAEREEDED